MIGIRGTAYDSEDRDFADSVGIRVIAIEEFFERGVASVMAEAREIAGDHKTYVSYDIDFIDPTFAPGTGTPEIGGPNSFQAIEVIRHLDGLNFAGADLVEVSPPFDPSGNTAYLAASLIFELLCVMAPALQARAEPAIHTIAFARTSSMTSALIHPPSEQGLPASCS